MGAINHKFEKFPKKKPSKLNREGLVNVEKAGCYKLANINMILDKHRSWTKATGLSGHTNVVCESEKNNRT